MRATTLVLLLGLFTPTVSAQGGGRLSTGNPTPGTEQPAPPNLADRVTFSGCVKHAPGAAAADGNTPTDARFVLTGVERVNRVPEGTGGSALTTGTPSRTYKLEAIEGVLSPFVGSKVEISGEIKPAPTNAPADASGGPTLIVEFVQKLAACPNP